MTTTDRDDFQIVINGYHVAAIYRDVTEVEVQAVVDRMKREDANLLSRYYGRVTPATYTVERTARLRKRRSGSWSCPQELA